MSWGYDISIMVSKIPLDLSCIRLRTALPVFSVDHFIAGQENKTEEKGQKEKLVQRKNLRDLLWRRHVHE